MRTIKRLLFRWMRRVDKWAHRPTPDVLNAEEWRKAAQRQRSETNRVYQILGDVEGELAHQLGHPNSVALPPQVVSIMPRYDAVPRFQYGPVEIEPSEPVHSHISTVQFDMYTFQCSVKECRDKLVRKVWFRTSPTRMGLDYVVSEEALREGSYNAANVVAEAVAYKVREALKKGSDAISTNLQ